jgi:hypothetical protein
MIPSPELAHLSRIAPTAGINPGGIEPNRAGILTTPGALDTLSGSWVPFQTVVAPDTANRAQSV